MAAINSSEKSSSRFFAFNSVQLKINLLVMGGSLGVALLLIALAVDIINRELSVTITSVRELYITNPVHWIILTAPAFLGVIFYFMGKLVSEREIRIELSAERDKEQFRLLEHFITDLEQGNLQTQMPEAFENKLVAARLNNFRDKLVQEKTVDEQRGWESQGLAQFGALLRSGYDLVRLADEVIRFLVRYTQCNQGAVFLTEGGEGDFPDLELKACYAFERKKYITKTIPAGQGLVGQCYLEKETIILYEVPGDYVKITSGLGMATPSFLAIIPLKVDDTVNGIVEVASFTRLEDYQVRFLEKACEAFASVIRSVVTAEHVRTLLDESRQREEDYRAQEAELRQSIEELRAIQEQMGRQLAENIATKKVNVEMD